METNNEEVNEYLMQMEQELQQANKDRRQLANAQTSLFGNPTDDNLIKWQLDLQEELDRIYYLLKGYQTTKDDKGNVIYVEPVDNDVKPFNEFGTQIIMNTIQFYVNKNTILSNYSSEVINFKVLDFGYRLSNLIHNRYEEMMLTTNFEEEFKKIYPDLILSRNKDGRMKYREEENGKENELTEEMMKSVNDRINEHLLGKLKMCEIICGAIVDSVHSAYNRALNGGERGSLREARTVTQNISPMSQYGMPMVSGGNHKAGILSRIRGSA